MTTALPAVANGAELWRTCARCQLPKDMKLFAPNGYVCKDCQKSPKPTVMDLRVKEAVEQVLDRIANHQTQAPSLDAFLTGVMARFGGLDAFVNKMVEDHQECRGAEKPNRKVIQDFNLAIMRLVRDLQALKGESPLKGISEDDLNTILFTAFAERVEEMTLDQLAAAASLKGYKLVPAEPELPEDYPPEALPDASGG